MFTRLQIHSLEYYEVMKRILEKFYSHGKLFMQNYNKRKITFLPNMRNKILWTFTTLDFLYLTRMFRVTGMTK